MAPASLAADPLSSLLVKARMPTTTEPISMPTSARTIIISSRVKADWELRELRPGPHRRANMDVTEAGTASSDQSSQLLMSSAVPSCLAGPLETMSTPSGLPVPGHFIMNSLPQGSFFCLGVRFLLATRSSRLVGQVLLFSIMYCSAACEI